MRREIMKMVSPPFLGIFLTGITLIFTGCASTRTKPINATVERFNGEARYSQAGNTWLSLKRDAVFNAGTTIQTAQKSFVDIAFDRREKPVRRLPIDPQYTVIASPEGPSLQSVRIFENTSLKIEQATKGEIRMRLNVGQIEGNTVKFDAPPVYQVTFTNGNATIFPGTMYMISASGIINIIYGDASLFLTDKNAAYKLTSGQSFDSSSGIISEMSKTQIQALRMILLRLDDEVEVVPLPIKQGMGGSMRKF